MNRAEVLLEALKEADRHVESLLRVNGSFAHGRAMSARDDVVKAITEKDGESDQPDMIRRDKHEEIVRELVSERDAIVQTSGELCPKCGWRMKFPSELCRCELLKPNPALENVLAKLREFVNKNTEMGEATPLLPTMKIDWLTLGDLRRWVDSEKGAGK